MMIKEKVEDVQWIGKAYSFAYAGYLPLTPKIGSILNKERRIHAFHVTSAKRGVTMLKSLEGTKKTISASTRLSIETKEDLDGPWSSGALYYLTGNLILESNIDAMTKPDESGRRWMDIYEVDTNLNQKYLDFKMKDRELMNLRTQFGGIDHLNIKNDKNKKITQEYLLKYLSVSTNFVEKNKTLIINTLVKKKFNDYDYNEVVVNNIKLIDVIYQLDETVDNNITPEDVQKTVLGKAIQIPTDTIYSEKKKMISDFISKREVG